MSGQVARAAATLQRAAVPATSKRLNDARAAGLRLVSPVRSRAKRAPFVVVVMTLLSAGLVGLIIMSTILQAQSFEAAELNREADALIIQQQALARDVDRLQSPSNVASRAIQEGMVPNSNPAFLRLSDGKVLGEPEAAEPGGTIDRVTR